MPDDANTESTEKHPLEETIAALARVKARVESLEGALTQQTEAMAELNTRTTNLEKAFQLATENAVKNIEQFLTQATNGNNENPATIE